MMHIVFREAEKTDIESCVDLAVRAFLNGPLLRAAAGSVKNYRMLMELLARSWLSSQTALVAVGDGRILALAVLANERQAAVRAVDCVRLGAGKVIRACGAGNIWALARAYAKFNRRFSRVSGPKRRLTLLAVEPEVQKRGVGSAMVRECILPFLREQGVRRLCLCTSGDRNRQFFRKNQFEELDSATARVGGRQISSWSFQREIS